MTKLSSQSGTESSRNDNDISNPYIGPRSFRKDPSDQSKFFGRDTEKDEIISRIMSHRLTLVYAQSGAGKTSIFNAEIIPALESEGFEVLPMTRVAITQLKPADNSYVYNALICIRDTVEDNLIRKKIDSQSLSELSLFEFLDYNFPVKRNENTNPTPQVLIFDQLEDLFTYFPNNWIEQRKDFFEQISDSLDNNPLLRVVFIIREDYLAQLDPYKSVVPEKLRPSFRLEKLRRDEATLAITGPLMGIIKNLSQGEVEGIKLEVDGLVNDLLITYLELPNGDLQKLEGEFVEPIHLQVVCRKWWKERTQKETTETEKNKLKQQGISNVDNALEEFYDRAVDVAKNIGSTEKKIRNWCEEKLITPSGTRSFIHRSTSLTEGMDNKVVDSLEGQYLIRREWRSGSPWYELTHDRLVKPIKDSNKKWELQKTKFRRSLLRKRVIIPIIVAIVIVTSLIAVGTQNKVEQKDMVIQSLELVNQGWTSYNSGDKKGAFEKFDAALELDPNNEDASFGKAFVLDDFRNFTGALYFYDKALAVDPNDYLTLYDKAIALDNLGRYEEAIIYYDKTLAINSTYIGALMNKGVALDNLGRSEEAIIYYDKALAVDPNDSLTLFHKGYTLDNLGRYEEAIIYYDKVLAINSTDTDTLFDKAIALDNLGRYEEAIIYYDKTLAINSTYIGALMNKGVDLDNLGRYEEAITYYDKVLAINSTDRDTLMNKGVALDNLGRSEEAITYYDKVLAINSTDLNTLYNKGVALGNLGRYEEAITYYDKALAINSTDVDTLFNKGIALDSLGRYEEAITYYDKVLAINSTDRDTLFNKGVALDSLGRYEEAITYYE